MMLKSGAFMLHEKREDAVIMYQQLARLHSTYIMYEAEYSAS